MTETVSLLRGQVSVVIASPRGGALLDACLRSVLPQATAVDAPVIVAGRGDLNRALDRLEQPAVVPVALEPDASLPSLRGAGLRAVRTPFAALIEDHCTAAPRWLESLGAAAPNGDVVGGRMGNAQRERTIDWAAYFAEYGFFSATTAAPAMVTAANVLYGHKALPLAARLATAGLREDVIHARLSDAGCRFAIAPAAEMLQNQRYTVAAFCLDRFRHGFDYARVRLREQPQTRRWLRSLAAPVLPVVLARRTAAHVAPPDRGAFARALPATLLFSSAWAAGEMAGYLRGPAV